MLKLVIIWYIIVIEKHMEGIMKIQIIGYDKSYDDSMVSNDITISKIDSPISFDTFDINVIDLNNENIWSYDGDSYAKINILNDLKSLNTIINNSPKSKILIIYPKNHNFKYYYVNNRFIKCVKIKDALIDVIDIIGTMYSLLRCLKMVYEIKKTTLLSSEYKSDFFFQNCDNILTKSDSSEKPTTINIFNNIYLSTLVDVLTNYDRLINFLTAINLCEQEIQYPEWLLDYNFYNDEEQKQLISINEEKIRFAKEEIDKSKLQLKENLKYKSILYNNGNELVTCVFDILQEILQCDLSNFSDEKNEDFLIKKEDVTFVGEIKGINSNVKYENVSQIARHYWKYLDKLQDEDKEENVKQILIINPLRFTPINERSCVNEMQIDLAKNNNCLIIETKVLLLLFEKYK